MMKNEMDNKTLEDNNDNSYGDARRVLNMYSMRCCWLHLALPKLLTIAFIFCARIYFKNQNNPRVLRLFHSTFHCMHSKVKVL